jgi:hypothetical protein
VAQRQSLSAYRIQILPLLARAELALGRPDQARADLESAAAVWEGERGLPLDPEWRELRGATGRRLFTELAGLILDDPEEEDPERRIAAAFDMLQTYKARTLRERMMGPGERATGESRSDAPAVTLDRLQAELLASDELFLDAYLGPERSLLFVVGPDRAAVRVLPGESRIGRRAARYFRLLTAPAETDEPPADETAMALAASGLAGFLFGDLEASLAAAEKIVIAPDGVLNLLPFVELPLRGEAAAGSEAPRPRREWMRVPSAAVLALLRDEARPASAAANARILAIAGTRIDSAEPLAGARAEVRGLAQRYRGVEARLPGGAPHAVAPMDLQGFDVLHFATHVRSFDQNPWQSQILLAAGETGDRLTAAAIVGLDLPASLAVLSSCESAGGRVLSGEGVQGLSSAFLSAGVPAVVATLWPVDDGSTATLMQRFYGELARGRSVSAALDSAQRALMAEPRTRHPFHWAGFVVVGDGDLALGLERRWPWRRIGALALILAGVALLVRIFR